MSRMLVWLVASGCVPYLYTQDGPVEASDWVAPVNSWEVSPPPGTVVAQGFDPGQTVPDLRLDDQLGDEVSLWQFYGDVILLDVSTVWCLPCQELAEHTEDTWLAYRDEGFVYLTVLQQDIYGDPATVEDAVGWAAYFGITAPVVADGDETAIDVVPYSGGTYAYPGIVLIGRDLQVIEQVDTTDYASIDAAIEAAL